MALATANRDDWGGVRVDDARTDDWGGIAVAPEPATDDWGGVAVKDAPLTEEGSAIAAATEDTGRGRVMSGLAQAGQSLYEGVGTAITGLATVGTRIDEARMGGDEAATRSELKSLQSTISKAEERGLDAADLIERARTLEGGLHSFGQAKAFQKVGEAARGVGAGFEPNPKFKDEFFAGTVPQVAGSAGASLAQMATGAGPALLFGQAYQATLERNLKKGTSVERSHDRALREGIISGGLESVGTGIVAGIAKRMAGKLATPSRLKEAAQGVVAEFLTGAGQEATSELIDEEKLEPLKIIKAGALEAMGAGMVIAPAMGIGKIRESLAQAPETLPIVEQGNAIASGDLQTAAKTAQDVLNTPVPSAEPEATSIPGGPISGAPLMYADSQLRESQLPKAENRSEGPGAAAATEFPEQGKVGAYNADVEARQKARGQTPTMSEARKEDPVTFGNAMDAIEKDPAAPEKLVEQIHADPKKPITDEQQQMLTWRRADLENRMAQESERAIDPDLSPDEQAVHQSNAELLESQLLRAEQANRMAGTASGRSLRSRQLEMNDDFTFAGLMMRRRKLTGEVVPPDVRTQIKAQADEIAVLQQKVAALDAEAAASTQAVERTQILEATIADLQKAEALRPKFGQEVFDIARGVVDRWKADADLARKSLRGRLGRTSAGLDPTILLDVARIMRAHIGELGLNFTEASAKLLEEFGDGIQPFLEKAWVKTQGLIDKEKTGPKVREKLKEGVAKPAKGEKKPADVRARAKAEASAKLPLSNRTAYKAVRAVIQSGVKGETEIMGAAHELLTESYPELTPGELDVAFSEYGKAKYPSTEATAVELSKLRALRQMQAAIDDVKRRGETAKSGVQRAKADEDVRKRQAELKLAIEQYGKEVPTSPEQLANRERIRLTRAQNAIADLDQELRTGETRIKAEPKMPSAELEQLQSELAAMRELKREIENAKNPPPPEHEVELKRLQDRADILRDRLARMELTQPKAEGKPTTDTAAISAVKSEIKTLTETMAELRKPIPLSPAQKALDAALVARERAGQTLDDISTGKTKPAALTKEALTQLEEDIRLETDALKQLVAQLRRDARPKTDPAAARERAQTKALEEAITRYEALAEKARAGTLIEVSKGRPSASAQVNMLRFIRDARRDAYLAAKKAGAPVRSPEERYNTTQARSIERQIKESERRIRDKDFGPRVKKTQPALSKANLDARAKLEKAKTEVRRGEEAFRLANRTRGRKILDGIRRANQARTNIFSSLDLSAPRQGLIYVLGSASRFATRPGMLLRPFRDMFIALRSEAQAARIDQAIKARSNRTTGVDTISGAQFQDIDNQSFTRGEENAHSILDEWAKIPIRTGSVPTTIARFAALAPVRAVRMSNRAFVTFLNSARAELLDHLLAVNFKDRAPTNTEIRLVGDIVNLATGRGNMSPRLASGLGYSGLWSPNLLISRLQFLTGQPLISAAARGEGRIVKIVAKEYARVIATGAMMYAISRLFDEDKDDKDKSKLARFLSEKKSTSSDFGKVIIKGENGGDTRVDLWGGFQQVTVLEERFRKAQTTNIDGQTRKAEGAQLGGVVFNFYRSKLRPDAQIAADILLRKNYKGDPTTAASVAKTLIPIPISAGELLPLLKAHGLPEAAALQALSLFGAGVSNYEDKPRPR